MKEVDIIESIAEHVEHKIFVEWKHEGSIESVCSEYLEVKIDGKLYEIRIEQIGTEPE